MFIRLWPEAGGVPGPNGTIVLSPPTPQQATTRLHTLTLKAMPVPITE